MNRKRLKSFWEYVEKTDTCWNWIGAIHIQGYGQYRQKLAHKISYEETFGKVKGGLELDHLCRNRRCVNPTHLEAVTRKENILRGTSITAINARKTNCKHGHPFSGNNLKFSRRLRSYAKNGKKSIQIQRVCVTCVKNWSKNYIRREKKQKKQLP